MSLPYELALRHVRPEETVLWWARPSLVGLVPILAWMVAATAGLVVATAYGLESPSLLFAGAPALVLAIGGILVETARRFIRLRFTTFLVTEERIYAITSFFETNARSIPLSRATHVSVRQGLAGLVFGFWSARISTYGEGGRALEIPAIRDGDGLLRETSAGMRRGANVAWLRRGDD